ncbi:hypothetical protein SAMN05660211_04489 [Enterocloster clostridioformis]|nr:hypothetical protein SAMN05660211_04489 [Enterocloster clostridioformis]
MDFSLPAGYSRRRRRLKKPGASAPGFTGVWGRSATNKRAPGIYRVIACRYLQLGIKGRAYSCQSSPFEPFSCRVKSCRLSSVVFPP